MTNNFRYLLAFGSNKGDRAEHIRAGFSLLSKSGKLRWASQAIVTPPLNSEFYDTSDHEPYLNQVVDWESQLSPVALYAEICVIEDQVGHDRLRKWQPRELDIDILFWAENSHEVFSDCHLLRFKDKNCSLEIPHSDFWNRDFLMNLVKENQGVRLSKLLEFTEKLPC